MSIRIGGDAVRFAWQSGCVVLVAFMAEQDWQ